MEMVSLTSVSMATWLKKCKKRKIPKIEMMITATNIAPRIIFALSNIGYLINMRFSSLIVKKKLNRISEKSAPLMANI